jgi:hypothetical protein
MFTHKYILETSKYVSHKINKVLLLVYKTKKIFATKYKNSIFECKKCEIVQYENKYYKITKNTYLNIVKNNICDNQLVICVSYL